MEDKKQAKIKQEKLKTHPKAEAKFLSHFLFCWELPIILKGWRKDLTEDDLYAPLKEYECKRLGDRLEELWFEEEHFSKKPSLWTCLIKQFGVEYMIRGIFYLPLELAVAILQPYFLRKILDYYTPNQTEITTQQAYSYAGGLSALAFFRVFSLHNFIFESTVIGMKVRVACSSLIYRRSLGIKKAAMEKITVGQLINIVSNDVTRFDQLAPNLHFLWIGVVEFIVGTYYIDYTLGHAAIAGGLIIVLSLVLQLFISFQVSRIRMKVATKTDYRIRLMNDIICGIEAVKIYTWEKPFAKIIELARRLEVNKITIASHCRLFNTSLNIYIGKLCVFSAVLACVLTNKPLTSQYVFVLVSMYESFKITLVIFLPLGVMMLSETLISVKRIEEFLMYDYAQPSILAKSLKTKNKEVEVCILKSHHEEKKKSPKVYLENIFVKWNKSWTNHVLDEVTFRAVPGELVGVIGRAGSGKSTLLHTILKETEVMKGNVDIEGEFSYASQEPWIFFTSVKQNILFGEDFDPDKYARVIKVCALERDLTLFPYGDQTLVGDRGVMLSGGQKARINLARAVYRDSDVYLLDDPLSAVDAHVARQIFDDCIRGYLKEKCVILVTHQIHYLQKADRIYQLEHGKVAKVGSYEKVVGVKDHYMDNISSEAPAIILQKHDLRVEVKEQRSTGTSNKKIYMGYCSAAGHWYFTFLVLLFFALGQLFVSLLDAFLTFWTNVEQKAIHLSSQFADFFTTYNSLYIYIGITVLSIVVIHLATFAFTLFCMKASNTLHDNMLIKVIHGTMNFFNHNPSGRILNRFAQDLGCIDEILPMYLRSLVTIICTGAAIIIIIIALNYWMIIPSIVLMAITLLFAAIFQPTNRNIKRTEGITRSTVLTHMLASIQGLATIRAHKTQQQLIHEFDSHQDLHSSAYYLFRATFAAFGFWTDFMAAGYTVLVIFSFFLLGSGTYVGNVGLAITQSINLLGMVQYGVKTWGELDSHMTSVERVIEYAELDPEPDEGKETPPEFWPNEGKVCFESVSLQYSSEEPPVLKKMVFGVEAGEKVGIIGRTGAGKTSLISVLFRLFPYEGSIVIDGVNTKSISLNTLRSKISIIPQEPILFLGTLRKNIDPFDEYSDSQLWQTLEELEMKPMINNLPLGLETMVSERGSNFSVGQRQLLCLMRAMLRNNKIIVLDEATANVDLRTDELIQLMIRKKLKDCTILTIAHRLNTVIDSDKILAMDNGRVIEFDHPYELLLKPDGFFYGFVEKSGDKMMKDFIKIAKNSKSKSMRKNTEGVAEVIGSN